MRIAPASYLCFPLVGYAAAAATTATFVPGPWVTIDASGHVSTITPILSGSSMVSPPPSVLTQPTAYVLSLDGHATTTTAAPPVASATGPGMPSFTGPGAAGAFMLCRGGNDSPDNTIAPFCQPRAGAQLTPNHTYYVTWDPVGWASNMTVELQAKYLQGSGVTGVSSMSLPAARGFCPWFVEADFIQTVANGIDPFNITFSLVYNSSTTDGGGDDDQLIRIIGPSILVITDPQEVSAHTGSHHVAVIAVPVVLGLAVLALLSYCVWSYRHHGNLPCIGRMVSRRTSSFSAKGYGVRKSYAQRTGTFGGAHNMDMGVYGPRVGEGAFLDGREEAAAAQRNAFREELRRQEEQSRV